MANIADSTDLALEMLLRRKQEPIAILVGSAVSQADAGYPSVQDFIAELWKALSQHSSWPPRVRHSLGRILDRVSKVQFEAFFQFFNDATGTEQLNDWLADHLVGGTPGPVSQMIADIAHRGNVVVMTSNFDTLLEQAIGWKEATVLQAISNPANRVIKLHGSLTDRSSMVTNLRQLPHQDEVRALIRSICHARPMMLVGYGCRDLDIFPGLLESGPCEAALDIQCLRSACPNESLAAYEREHWRQVMLQVQRPAVCAHDFKVLAKRYLAAVGLTPWPTAGQRQVKVGQPILTENRAQLTAFLASIIDYIADAGTWKATRHGLDLHEETLRQLDRQILIQGHQFALAEASARLSIVSCTNSLDIALARADVGRCQANQRRFLVAFGFVSTLRAYLGVRRLSKSISTPQDRDKALRCEHHAAVGLLVISNELYRYRIWPFGWVIGFLGQRLAGAVIVGARQSGDVYRMLVMEGEALRNTAYSSKGRFRASDRLLFVVQQLIGIGRAKEATMFIAAGVRFSPCKRTEFRELLWRHMVRDSIEYEWPMTLLKGLALIRSNEPVVRDFSKQCRLWAKHRGDLGFFSPSLFFARRRRPEEVVEADELLKELGSLDSRGLCL